MTNVKKALGVNLKLLWIIRLYFFDNSASFHKFQGYLMYVIFLLPIPCLGILNLFVKDELDMERVNYDAAVISESACFIPKYYFFIKNIDQITKCIQYFEYSQFLIDLNPRQKQIQKNYIKICQRNTFIYLSVIAVGVAGWIINPFFWEEVQLPADIWLPFDISSKTYIFYLVYFFMAICGLYIAISTTVDPLIGALICLTTAQLKILQDKLQYLDVYAGEDLKRKENLNLDKDVIIYNNIKKCVLFHNEIIKVVRELEKCFSFTLFSQIFVGVLCMCFACLRLMKLPVTEIGSIFQSGIYIVVVIAQVYFYCNYASTVSEESNNLTNAIYMSNWYNYNMKSKKALGVLMARSQKPIIIISGGIIELSLDTFVTTLKRTYSLIALLKNYS